ncbi:MAG: sensor histidine kinase [Moorellales bacterium]
MSAAVGLKRTVLPINLLQPLLDALGEFTGLWLKFVDTEGEYVITPGTRQPCRFCQLVRSTPEGRARCKASAKAAVRECGLEVRGHYSRCHALVSRLTVPIVLNGECHGALVCGEIVVGPPGEEELRAVAVLAEAIGVDKRELVRAYREIPPWDGDRLRMTPEVLSALTHCFIKMGLAVASKERAEMERQRREIELKALQAQINPHFLFNALNTVTMLALVEGAPQTRRAVKALADLLRSAFRPKDLLTPLRQELQNVENYLYIQQIRFGERLKVEKNFPEALLDALVPPFSLQPLVENALVHGLEPLEQGGKLSLGGYWDAGGKVRLVVADTGVGMSPERLAEIRGEMEREEGLGATHGLANVHRRLRLMFGEAGGVEIRSQVGSGTQVCLSLPYLVEEGVRMHEHQGTGSR